MGGRRHHQAPVRKFSFISRRQAVRSATLALQRHGWPRVQMAMIVAFTGLTGFLASVILLYAGVEQMAARYPLAIACAYLIFLFELWLWMHTHDSWDGSSLDVNPGSGDGGGSGGGGAGGGFEGGGGDFGGGGASGTWDLSSDASDGPGSALEAVGDSIGSAADGEEGCLVVVVLLLIMVLVGGLLASAVYLVWGAPILMGELLVDAALSYGLYRNLRKQDREWWLYTALRRTGGLFLLAAVLATVAGAVLAHLVPGARTLSEAMDGARAIQAEEGK